MSANTPDASGQTPLFQTKDVICRTEIEDSAALIEAMVALLAENHGGIDANSAFKAVMDREAESPTFIAEHVAMPHARLDGITEPLVAVATSEDGIGCGASGQAANLVFLVLTPRCSPAAYLKIAAMIARHLRSGGLVADALAGVTPEELHALFHGGERVGHSSVAASDMMAPPAAVLRENNSVKDAIDTIVRTGLPEIPVVDKEGDLVGVATARALLGVCIPEYMLWMEDLSPFSNFEPFETLLRKESSTWLADITDDDYASVSVDQPAIAVAEAMARHKTNRCFVLDGARLVGVVTLPSFLNNVFRD